VTIGPRHILTIVVLLLASVTVGSLLCKADGEPVEVLYIVGFGYPPLRNPSIQTYNVDPQTGIAIKRGSPLRINSQDISLVPGLGDKLLYLISTKRKPKFERQLLVYRTLPDGEPIEPPIQTLKLPQLTYIQPHPTKPFVYAMSRYQNLIWNPPATYFTSLFDITSGGSLNRRTEEWHSDGYFQDYALYGTDSKGSKLYLGSTPGLGSGAGVTYYSQAIDPEDGSLATPAYLFCACGNEGDSLDAAISDRLIAFTHGFSYGDFYHSTVTLYPNTPNPDPLFVCDGSMLPTCGSAGNVWIDPSNHYVLISGEPLSQESTTVVTRIDLENQRLIPVGQIPYWQLQFNGSGSLLYGWPWNKPGVQIYRFDRATGKTTPGSLIPLSAETVVPAQRQ